jgi:hypothetical protein
MRLTNQRPLRWIAGTAFGGLVVAANAQFADTGSTITSNVDFGDQNGNSYQSDYHDTQTSTDLASGSVGSADQYTGDAYNYTYYGVGSASMTSFIGQGGILESFSDASQIQQTGGGNSFVGPASESSSSADIVFMVGASGSYALIANGSITAALNNNDYSFQGNLTDLTTQQVIQNINVAAASSSLNPLNTTVNLVAGDSYELSFYALSYDIVFGQSGVSDINAGAFNGYVQVGAPAAPEPLTLGFLAASVGMMVRKRKRRV